MHHLELTTSSTHWLRAGYGTSRCARVSELPIAHTKKTPHCSDFVQVWLAIGWMFLVFTILCRTTFRSFACQDIDDGENSRGRRRHSPAGLSFSFPHRFFT
jgi:hypothetical protein